MTWRAGVDVLSFGATKNGAMTADAIVVFDGRLTEQLGYRTKRAGQLASKMRFHSAQITAYLDNDLWLRNAAHANAMAPGYAEARPSRQATPTDPAANIVFARCHGPPSRSGTQGFTFYHDRWAPGVCRFVTSFQTQPDDVDDLIDSVRTHLVEQPAQTHRPADAPADYDAALPLRSAHWHGQAVPVEERSVGRDSAGPAGASSEPAEGSVDLVSPPDVMPGERSPTGTATQACVTVGGKTRLAKVMHGHCPGWPGLHYANGEAF